MSTIRQIYERSFNQAFQEGYRFSSRKEAAVSDRVAGIVNAVKEHIAANPEVYIGGAAGAAGGAALGAAAGEEGSRGRSAAIGALLGGGAGAGAGYGYKRTRRGAKGLERPEPKAESAPETDESLIPWEDPNQGPPRTTQPKSKQKKNIRAREEEIADNHGLWLRGEVSEVVDGVPVRRPATKKELEAALPGKWEDQLPGSRQERVEMLAGLKDLEELRALEMGGGSNSAEKYFVDSDALQAKSRAKFEAAERGRKQRARPKRPSTSSNRRGGGMGHGDKGPGKGRRKNSSYRRPGVLDFLSQRLGR